jgi:hypothetical protein
MNGVAAQNRQWSFNLVKPGASGDGGRDKDKVI